MQIEFGGDFQVPRKPDEVFDFLVDPDRFCPLLPDYQSMKREDDRHFTVHLRVGISHIRGTAAVRLALAEAERPRRAVYRGQGDIPGGTATVTAGFSIERAGGGTKVSWNGQAQIAGRLPALAGGLLEPLAKKNLQKLIDSLQAALK